MVKDGEQAVERKVNELAEMEVRLQRVPRRQQEEAVVVTGFANAQMPATSETNGKRQENLGKGDGKRSSGDGSFEEVITRTSTSTKEKRSKKRKVGEATGEEKEAKNLGKNRPNRKAAPVMATPSLTEKRRTAKKGQEEDESEGENFVQHENEQEDDDETKEKQNEKEKEKLPELVNSSHVPLPWKGRLGYVSLQSFSCS